MLQHNAGTKNEPERPEEEKEPRMDTDLHGSAPRNRPASFHPCLSVLIRGCFLPFPFALPRSFRAGIFWSTTVDFSVSGDPCPPTADRWPLTAFLGNNWRTFRVRGERVWELGIVGEKAKSRKWGMCARFGHFGFVVFSPREGRKNYLFQSALYPTSATAIGENGRPKARGSRPIRSGAMSGTGNEKGNHR